MKRIPVLGTFFLVFAVSAASAQSTATLAGTVKDATGAVLPNATVVLHNNGTGTDRTINSDGAGQYVVPSLAPGDYRISVTAPGFNSYIVKSYVLQVDQKATLDVPLAPASTGQTVEVEGTAPALQTETITVGQVIDARTVQEVPLNGRHFLDLTVLTAGGVTAPATGSLTAPSRGLGANSFVTAGNREDSVNFQINGVNLNDMVQNQITFQPSIDTTSEFRVNNQTYSSEYGRSSGSVVNVATRSGINHFHGEAFEYLRNNALDARNYFNPKGTQMLQFIRSNFGASLGGPIYRNNTFFFASYEGLRQHQGIPLNSPVLNAAQRAGVTNPVMQNLLQYIPSPNMTNAAGQAYYVGTAAGPVQIDQGTGDLEQIFNEKDTLHGFYALQEDTRTEPTLQGDTLPGFGDHRHAKRQILTVNETHVFSPRVVNDARIGFNRININFIPNVTTDPTTLGLGTGTTGPNGIPFTTLTGFFSFGGPASFPQGRVDTLGVLNDTVTYSVGRHTVKFGGEYRRFINANYTGDTGTLTFNTLANFQAGSANAYNITPSVQTSRVYVNAVNGFLQDDFHVSPALLVELGFRYEWNGSPTAGNNKFVNFNPTLDYLEQVGTNGLGRSPYAQNNNYEPRLGFSYNVGGKSRTVLRGAYGLMADQPETNLVTGLATNAPFTNKVNYSSSTAPIPVSNLFSSAAAAGLSITAVDPGYRNAYTQDFNLNLQQQSFDDITFSIGYYGSVGRHLRQTVNLNEQGFGTKRPYQALSISSPIDPGANLSNANLPQSNYSGQSNYNALWFTAQKNFRSSLEFNFNYNLSKSFDLGSLGTTYLQDITRPRLNYGLSDFDTRHRIATNVVYNLPFKGNRFVEGFRLTGIAQWQTGNPLNVTDTVTTFSGLSGLTHPNLLTPVKYVKSRPSATTVQWFTNSVCTQVATTAGCTFQVPTNGFGNLSRNALTGPGFADVDVSLEKNTKIYEKASLQLRLDAFDVANHANFSNPGTSAAVGSASFGTITSTRFPTGDSGSSRQLQVAAKIIF